MLKIDKISQICYKYFPPIIWKQTLRLLRSLTLPNTYNNIMTGANKKGLLKRKMTCYKKGRRAHNKGQFQDPQELSDVVSTRYIRPTTSELNMAEEDPIRHREGSKQEASDNRCESVMVLRPKRDLPLEVEKKNFGLINGRDEANCYRLLHTGKLWEMINYVTHEHRRHNPICEGNLDFNYRAEEKRGLCWREQVVCKSCSYVSKKFNLFNEIETGRPGRKAATANVGMNVALTQTPIGPTSLRKMCLSSSIPAPSRRGLQKCATKVCEMIEKVNISDMKTRRAGLKRINLLRGRPENEISVQSDGIFNNPLYSGVGKTPFQPATQCSYSIVENITPKKQVIAVENVNKLCSKHGFHSANDEECDILSGKCSATVPMEKSIGDEKEWAKSCLLDLKDDDLEVKHITTDPDTGAFKAAEELKEQHITSTVPEHQIDTRHLSENHRKYIRNKPAVLKIMPGYTKAYRETMQNRFSSELSMRCQAEFENAHQDVGDNFTRLKARICEITDAIILCYSGDHTLCRTQSSICMGETDNNCILKSAFLPGTFKIKASETTSKSTVRDCIDYRFRPDILEKTKLNTNTQKVEAVNHIIRRSLPKTVTFSRNFSGRAHSAIFAANNGPGEALLKLCEQTGCPVPSNSRVSAALLGEQVSSEKEKERGRSAKRKLRRKQVTIKKFKIYEKNQEEIKYRKAKLLLEAAVKRRTHARMNKFVRSDHSYTGKTLAKCKKLLQKDHTYPSKHTRTRKPHNKHGGECSSEQVPEKWQ